MNLRYYPNYYRFHLLPPQFQKMTKSTADTLKASRKSYTIDKKIEVISYAKKNSINKAALKFFLDRKSIRTWIANEASLLKVKEAVSGSFKKRIPRSIILKEEKLEEMLLIWIKQQRAKKLRVTRHLVLREARIFLKQIEADRNSESSLKLSNGWLQRFIHRNDLSYRKPTSVAQKLPKDYLNQLVKFFIDLSKRIKEQKYSSIIACDETGVWLDAVGGLCLDEKGSKDVTVLSTGHEKTRITVMLSATAEGKKLLPFVILPRKRVDNQLEKKYHGKIKISYGGIKSWMDDQQADLYLRSIIGQTLFGKRLLVWDACSSHTSEKSKKVLKELNVETVIVPGGTTRFVQPADVVWNKPFKQRIKEQYEEWFASDERTFTKSGNPRGPPPDTYLSWILKSWNELPEDMIKKSFKVCGIGVADDGSEDDVIHCFSDGGPIPEGKDALKEARDMKEIEETLSDLSFASKNSDEINTDLNENEILSDISDMSLDLSLLN